MFSDVLYQMFSDSCADFGYFWVASNESIGFDDPKEFDDPNSLMIQKESMDVDNPKVQKVISPYSICSVN